MIAIIILIIGVFGCLITMEICDYLSEKNKKESGGEQMIVDIIFFIGIFVYLIVGEICDYLKEKNRHKGADIDE